MTAPRNKSTPLGPATEPGTPSEGSRQVLAAEAKALPPAALPSPQFFVSKPRSSLPGCKHHWLPSPHLSRIVWRAPLHSSARPPHRHCFFCGTQQSKRHASILNTCQQIMGPPTAVLPTMSLHHGKAPTTFSRCLESSTATSFLCPPPELN